jgi:hypothetical protein
VPARRELARQRRRLPLGASDQRMKAVEHVHDVEASRGRIGAPGRVAHVRSAEMGLEPEIEDEE